MVNPVDPPSDFTSTINFNNPIDLGSKDRTTWRYFTDYSLAVPLSRFIFLLDLEFPLRFLIYFYPLMISNYLIAIATSIVIISIIAFLLNHHMITLIIA
jgi:hypothetical protein